MGRDGMGLAGKTALVTGSTSGIGLGIARALARDGANIMLNGFGDAGAIEALRDDLATEARVAVGYHPADLNRPEEVAALVTACAARFGRVDILVNNAGIQHVAPIEDFPRERWDAVIAVNLSAVFHATKAALPGMKHAGWGRIINIASAHGLVASENKSAYVAAKHAVVGLTKVAALETAEHGITVNAICPGWVRTPLVERQLEARAQTDGIGVEAAGRLFLAEKQPMPRFTTPDQIGAMAVFLCSDAAATITGTPLSMDGGWLAR
jgi:3-hydroxybutyrate dehydrogenase